MAGNKRLLIFKDKICSNQNKVKVEKKHKTYYFEIFIRNGIFLYFQSKMA